MNRTHKLLTIAALILMPMTAVAWTITLISWYQESRSSEPINLLAALVISALWAVLAAYNKRVKSHENIKSTFEYHTQRALNNIRVQITGINEPLKREEVSLIEDQFNFRLPVLLSGEPGTGKSGVAFFLAKAAISNGKTVLYIDARSLQHIQDEAELQRFFSITEPLNQIIHVLSAEPGFLLIIDQFDNAVNRNIANVLLQLALACNPSVVDILVVSRSREGHESKLLKRLTEQNFTTIPCREISSEQSSKLLTHLGIEHASGELIEMCRNLLNLDLVATIKRRQPTFNFSNIFNEVALWDGYIDMIVDREAERSNPAAADQMLDEAMGLARQALQAGKQTFVIEQLSASHRRLESWGVIFNVERRLYRFAHEKLQDYLYARYAADRGAMPNQVLSEVNSLKSKSVFAWIEQIYAARNSAHLVQFVKETLNG